MGNVVTVPRSFAADFEVWAAKQLAHGDTPAGIEEIRAEIRRALAEDPDAARYWTQRITQEAAAIRSTGGRW